MWACIHRMRLNWNLNRIRYQYKKWKNYLVFCRIVRIIENQVLKCNILETVFYLTNNFSERIIITHYFIGDYYTKKPLFAIVWTFPIGIKYVEKKALVISLEMQNNCSNFLSSKYHDLEVIWQNISWNIFLETVAWYSQTR